MEKPQQNRQTKFGVDLMLELWASSFELSIENRLGLKKFFRILVPLTGMEVLPTPTAYHIIAGLKIFGLADSWLFSWFVRWLRDPRIYQITGQGKDRDGVTMTQMIQTSEISLHTWPDLNYARLTISTCSPQKLFPDRVIGFIEKYLNAKVYYYELYPWQGPKSLPRVSSGFIIMPERRTTNGLGS